MKNLLPLLLFLISGALHAQLGGQTVYNFLNVVPSARVAAQGGNAIANPENDLNFALWNPSLLNKEMSGQVSISMVDYLSDILLGDVSYARHYDSIGTFSLGVRYMNYGDFDRANEIGIREGTFTANDVAITSGYSYTIDTNWSVGANLKYINSTYESYGSSGMAVDLAATYQIPKKRMVVALVAKNLGFQFDPYYEDKEPLPFELQLGFSSQFEHLPLRWQVTLEQLETWDLRYDDPGNVSVNQLTGEVERDDPTVLNNILRHVVVGAEFSPVKTFNVQIGYSFRKNNELKLDTRRTSAGLSFGLGIRIAKRIYVNYARNAFHVAGAANHFSIKTDLGDFKKDKSQ